MIGLTFSQSVASREGTILSPFHKEEPETQRGVVTGPSSHSKWQSLSLSHVGHWDPVLPLRLPTFPAEACCVLLFLEDTGSRKHVPCLLRHTTHEETGCRGNPPQGEGE